MSSVGPSRLIKEMVKLALYRPWGVPLGEQSFLWRPWSLAGRRHLTIGKRTSIGPNFRMQAITTYAGRTYTPRIEIGDDVYIGGHAYFTAVDRIVIGDGCVLSEHVYITDENHGMDPRGPLIMKQPLVSKGPVVIGRGSFLGFRVAVMPGVELGEHCVVGANSTVTRSFAAYSMIGGTPARLLKRYSHTQQAWIAAEAADTRHDLGSLDAEQIQRT